MKTNLADSMKKDFILYWVILLAILVRVSLFFVMPTETASSPIQAGCLWNPFASFFSDFRIGLIASSICVILIALLLAHINTQYILIRTKTSLPIAFPILLLGVNPAFIAMQPAYINIICFLLATSALFASYQLEGAQRAIAAANASVILALGSLFSPILVLYIPLFWIGLYLMRNFYLKSFLASLIALAIVYLSIYSYFYFTGTLSLFLAPIATIETEILGQLPLMEFTVPDYLLLAIATFGLLFLLINSSVHSNKDSIRSRKYIRFLSISTVTASLLYLLLNIYPQDNLFIALVVGSLLLAHYFALAESKASLLFFYFTLLFYLAVSLYYFLL